MMMPGVMQVLEGLTYLINLYKNWTFALFYIVSEIYSSVSQGVRLPPSLPSFIHLMD